MVTVSPPPPALAAEQLTLYFAYEPLFNNLPVLVFYGPSTTDNTTQNSSRIQAHIYSVAGFHSFPRLTVSPASSLYKAVQHLPLDLQGDEVFRGIAISLLSYFAAIPKQTKDALQALAASHLEDKIAPVMFDEMHAGDLAARMTESRKTRDIVSCLRDALPTRVLSWTDVDVLLPQSSIKRATRPGEDGTTVPVCDENGLPLFEFGRYTSLVEALGSPMFLPTSKLQRAPSRQSAQLKTKASIKDRVIAMRREMGELIDTEGNYISKVRNILTAVAPYLKDDIPLESFQELFPKSLEQILEVNQSFYAQIESIFINTESAAQEDFDEELNVSNAGDKGSKNDTAGITAFAKAVLQSIPLFSYPYKDYLRASSKFHSVLSYCMSDEDGDFAVKVRDLGEQHLKSLLIEPVQRLPRYSLFIDNILSSLPTSHPATPILLKCRDALSDICSLEETSSGKTSRAAKVLKHLVTDWPEKFMPPGRMIAAADVYQLEAPYTSNSPAYAAIMLVFPGRLIFLRKAREDSMSSRGLLAEVSQQGLSLGSSIFRPDAEPGLFFDHVDDIRSTLIQESSDGCYLYLSNVPNSTLLDHETLSVKTKVLSLHAPYHGKASRLVQEIVKARIESRYPACIREGDKWALRSSESTKETLGMLSSISEAEDKPSIQQQNAMAQVCLYIDSTIPIDEVLANRTSSCIAANISRTFLGGYSLEVESTDGQRFRDDCDPVSFPSLFRRRVEHMLLSFYKAECPTIAFQQASFHANILKTLSFQDAKDTKSKGFRPRSPVKAISNMLSGSGKLPTTPSKQRSRPDLSAIWPKDSPRSLPSALRSSPDKPKADGTNLKAASTVKSDASSAAEQMAILEETLAAYIVALRSQKANMVGRFLQGRKSADELKVNELYNTLLEDPERVEIAISVPVDVLFAAFEKFMRSAWRDSMGALLPRSAIDEMISSLNAKSQSGFVAQIQRTVNELTPQNRRAFDYIIKLLASLLQASNSDSDYEELLASFAEAIFMVDDLHGYTSLLDRIVEDYDKPFNDEGDKGEHRSASATSTLSRTRSFNMGSARSNKSSLRKRLGLTGTLTRGATKHELESKLEHKLESKASAIWRSLGKSTRSPGDSFFQPKLHRSKSTDTDNRSCPPSRPASRDRPTTSASGHYFASESRPGSMRLPDFDGGLNDDQTSKRGTTRRSSLTDALTDALSHQHDDEPAFSNENALGIMTSATPSKKEVKSDAGSQHKSMIPRYNSPGLKENATRDLPRTPSRPTTSGSDAHGRPASSKISIPAPRVGLSELAWPPNGTVTPASTTTTKPAPSSPPKMRVQSPTKLRQRLNEEQKASAAEKEGFEEEMQRIKQTVEALKKPKYRNTAVFEQQKHPEFQVILNRLQTLESRFWAHSAEQAAQSSAMQADLETSLLVSDRKAHELDELYKEANAENEALYDRFNDELNHVSARFAQGEGAALLKAKLTEAQAEVRRLKGENVKQKREIAGLKSVIGAAGVS